MKKLKYEKPISLDAGKVATIQGLSCSGGNSANEGCRTGYAATGGGCALGEDPSVIPYCPNGSIATGNCYPAGGTADNSCHVGTKPAW